MVSSYICFIHTKDRRYRLLVSIQVIVERTLIMNTGTALVKGLVLNSLIKQNIPSHPWDPAARNRRRSRRRRRRSRPAAEDTSMR